MPVIPIESAKAGMKLDKDVYSDAGIKLAGRGTSLTDKQIRLLIQYNVRVIEVEAAPASIPADSPRLPPAPELDKEKVGHILQGIPMFEPLTPEQLELVMARFEIRKYPARSLLFREGDPGDSFFIVLKGAVKIFIHGQEGREKTMSVFRPGDSFGELSLLDGMPRSASAQTLQKTELLAISHADFLLLLQEHFDIARAILAQLSARIRDTNQHLRDLVAFDARTRVIRGLIQMASRHGRRSKNAIEVALPLDLNELAELVGVRLAELQQALNRLDETGLIRMSEGRFVLNLERLRANQ
ncbi:Crp/Fnr family transcriptional regulator [Cohnella caldifontis]|uniref:Crp/Fnr family transcriptional regulator n=1 Tax=Cohnella caldifontis TaxID=3027471 RepID=UPI0023ECC308|nr:Crp/Fnr family transcriptional regulator [Cohnella sp. YIM B05605]